MSGIRVRRSALYVPGSNLKAIEKARSLPCDVVIIDLEDAVAPAMKEAARANALAAASAGFGEREIIVRVNALSSPWGTDDLTALANASISGILIPKVDSGAGVASYAEALAGKTPLWAMIETARSVLRLEDIASAPRLAAFVMGTNDLAKEMGAKLDAHREPFIGLMALTVAAARAYGLAVLDGVYNQLNDLDVFASQCRQGATLGFDGKTLIHPSQIEPCNRAFSPSSEEVVEAEAIVAAFDAVENAEKGAIRVNGHMVERLHLDRAKRVLAAASLIGLPASTC